jgi:hypothetical protein
MEHFFTPTRRLQDRHDYMFDEPLGYTEVQIAVSIGTQPHFGFKRKQLCQEFDNELVKGHNH